MNISSSTADWLFLVSNVGMVVSSIVALVFSATVIWSGTVKEHYSNERIALNEAETAHANAEAANATKQTEELKVRNAALEVQTEQAKAEAAKAHERITENELETSRAKVELAKASARITENEALTAKAKAEAEVANKQTEKLKVQSLVLQAEIANSKVAAAKLNEQTEQLKADNLIVQKVMITRHVGLIGIDEEPKAKQYFARAIDFAGTEVFIQVAPDAEARNLANEIAIVLIKFGWIVNFIDEKRSHKTLSANDEGIEVLYPSGRSWTPERTNEPWFRWAKAADVLADALTQAGLGIVDTPIHAGGMNNDAKYAGLMTYFDPPLTGVYLKVGVRPVSLTLQQLAQKRGGKGM